MNPTKNQNQKPDQEKKTKRRKKKVKASERGCSIYSEEGVCEKWVRLLRYTFASTLTLVQFCFAGNGKDPLVFFSLCSHKCGIAKGRGSNRSCSYLRHQNCSYSSTEISDLFLTSLHGSVRLPFSFMWMQLLAPSLHHSNCKESERVVSCHPCTIFPSTITLSASLYGLITGLITQGHSAQRWAKSSLKDQRQREAMVPEKRIESSSIYRSSILLWVKQ